MQKVKQYWMFIYADGMVSCSDSKLTEEQAAEMYDEGMGYDIVSYYPMKLAVSMADSILKLAKKYD